MWKPVAAALWIVMASAGSAVAQERDFCFDQGTTRISSNAYAVARLVGEDMARREPWRAYVALRVPPRAAAGDIANDRIAEAQLELMKVGVGIQRVKLEPADVVDPDCFGVEVVDGSWPPPLWHHRGPYFGSGGVDVAESWRKAMRFIVADYVPGTTRYCIDAHADTVGSVEANLDLSRRRADSVARELARQGVLWTDIQQNWHGEARLARPTADEVAEPLNRRVTIDVRMRCPATSR